MKLQSISTEEKGKVKGRRKEIVKEQKGMRSL